MSSSAKNLRAFLAAAPAAALVEVAKAKGSTPREKGAWMLVSPTSIFGTIASPLGFVGLSGDVAPSFSPSSARAPTGLSKNTLTGVPKEMYRFWDEHLRPLGYKARFQVVDFSDGVPGDIAITLKWG